MIPRAVGDDEFVQGISTAPPPPVDAEATAIHWAKVPLVVMTYNAISAGARLLWAWLDEKAHPTPIAKVSYEELAAAFGCTEKTIQRQMKQLKEHGLIKVERKPAGHGRGHYRIINPARPGSSWAPPGSRLGRTEMSRDRNVSPLRTDIRVDDSDTDVTPRGRRTDTDVTPTGVYEESQGVLPPTLREQNRCRTCSSLLTRRSTDPKDEPLCDCPW